MTLKATFLAFCASRPALAADYLTLLAKEPDRSLHSLVNDVGSLPKAAPQAFADPSEQHSSHPPNGGHPIPMAETIRTGASRVGEPLYGASPEVAAHTGEWQLARRSRRYSP